MHYRPLSRRAWPWLLAALLLVAALPTRTPPSARCAEGAPRSGIDHTARCERGTTVRASSVDRTRGHELLLIDGDRLSPGRFWRASARDPRPTLELAFATARAITGLALHRARDAERAFGPLDVAIQVRTAGGWRALGRISGDTRAVARWITRPLEVDGLRLSLSSPDGQPIALTEVEVLGPIAGSP